MNEKLMEKYKECTRFGDGERGRSREYTDITRRKEMMQVLLANLFGKSILPILEEYTETLYEEMELEAQHFFEQGYRAAVSHA